MRSLLVASLSSLFFATASLSGCASEPAGGGDGSAVSEIEDGPLAATLVGDYRPLDGGFPRLTLEADGTYVYDTGIRCFQAPCPSGDAGTWRLDWYGNVRLRASDPDALEPQRFVEVASGEQPTLWIEDADGVTHELAKFVEPALVGDYRPADGDFPRLTLEADGTYLFDTGVRCFRAPCPSGDAGTWHLSPDGTLRLAATSPDALAPRRSVEIASGDPLTILIDDETGATRELTKIDEAAPAASCAAVLCVVGTRCEIVDGAAQCVP
jgi:hypothetical protein